MSLNHVFKSQIMSSSLISCLEIISSSLISCLFTKSYFFMSVHEIYPIYLFPTPSYVNIFNYTFYIIFLHPILVIRDWKLRNRSEIMMLETPDTPILLSWPW